jgi:hypothetical protein
MSLAGLLLGLVLLAAQDPAAEFRRLADEFEAAEQKYFEAAQGPRPARLDPARHPRHEFVPRFEALALRAQASETGCRSWGWVLEHADDAPESRARALAALGGEYLGSPLLEELVPELAWPAERAGRAETAALLEKILAGSPHAEVRAAVLFTQARAVAGLGSAGEAQRADARARLERLQKEFGATEYAAQAEGLLFELEHLQIGMVAPDFEATDAEGRPWKLSDYRGKVVVLEFWGFW